MPAQKGTFRSTSPGSRFNRGRGQVSNNVLTSGNPASTLERVSDAGLIDIIGKGAKAGNPQGNRLVQDALAESNRRFNRTR